MTPYRHHLSRPPNVLATPHTAYPFSRSLVQSQKLAPPLRISGYEFQVEAAVVVGCGSQLLVYVFGRPGCLSAISDFLFLFLSIFFHVSVALWRPAAPWAWICTGLARMVLVGRTHKNVQEDVQGKGEGA
jgi:hypothetical protein